MSRHLATALARNRAFAADGRHQGAVVFPNLRLFVITCVDPRVDPAHFLGLGLGDALVVRNVGGRVTPEVINDVAFIGQLAEHVLPGGPLFEVAVIHHTQCGTGALADDTFRRRYAERIGADESTLREHAVLDPAATVIRDVERVRSAPAISPRVRACLRRRHRPGADDRSRRRLTGQGPELPRPAGVSHFAQRRDVVGA
jgi:carbonic anhydrase